MSEATNTPRTDDLVVRYIHMNEFDSLQTDGVICIVDIEAVRQLERELTQAQAELVKQSELVQREWLSPAEAEGLRRELAAVKAERDALRADAERYRWLRDNHETNTVAGGIVYEVTGRHWNDAIDTAMSAARAQQPGGRGE